ncbi:MAG TPA: hypothetical protein VFW79_05650 [Cellulomonas sp.]|uniref:hypothetical protein n=1 Tax=Cellulomonas sp. TaxID=40001 RepID=UPI002E3501A0|nr:hypothetical protein [Cellulomonas sp.]HEX5332110.1 hypothetical protein [Cellulomonas sp.]
MSGGTEGSQPDDALPDDPARAADGFGDDLTIPDDLSSLTESPEPASTEPDGEVTIPDDLSSLTESADDPVTVALVVTQVAAAGPLAAACSLAKVDVDVVPSPVGALALLRDPRTAAAGAAAISKLLKAVPVVLLERRASQITATRWTAGEQGDELPAGLVLSDAPAVLEDLLLGGVSVGDLDGVVTSVGLSRWKAMRMLASSTRGPRR